jgi:hypothetical protein
MGVNRLYVRAVNPVYGVYWANPRTSYITMETGWGAQNLFPKLIARAHQSGLKVLCYMEPIRMKSVWTSRSDWREKDAAGADYKASSYPLSVYNTGYLAWLDGFLNEILDLGVDGVDIAECDYAVWGTGATYDAAANSRFFSEYPSGTLGDSNWVALRKRVLTEWYARIGNLVTGRGKEYHVTYTWNASANGQLFEESYLADRTGFSFDQILDLPEGSRPTHIQAELIWQEQAATHGTNLFNATWTASGAAQFMSFVDDRARGIIHAEVTPFTRTYTVTPRPDEIFTSLWLALEGGDGADVYDHNQVCQLQYDYNGAVTNWAATMVSNVYNAASP